eukprot:761475-Hanusia_phi.AAC.2
MSQMKQVSLCFSRSLSVTCDKASSSSITKTLRVSKALASRIPETIKESPSPRKGGQPVEDLNDRYRWCDPLQFTHLEPVANPSAETAASEAQSRGVCPVCNEEVSILGIHACCPD